jgi:hypothetical protein
MNDAGARVGREGVTMTAVSVAGVTVLRWLLGACLMVALTLGVVYYLRGGYVEWQPCLAGWTVAVANAGAACWLNRRALRSSASRFLWWAVGGNGLRVGLLLALLTGAALSGGSAARSFLVAVLTGYLVFLLLEVGSLHWSSREVRPKS